MTYDAIINGATGVLFWGVHTLKPDDQLWKDLKGVASELKSIYNLLTCPFVLLPEWINVDTGQNENHIKCLIKLIDKKTYVFALNTRDKPIKNVTFNLVRRGGEPTLKNVKVLLEEREISFKEDISWTDDFEGYFVFLDVYYLGCGYVHVRGVVAYIEPVAG